MANDFAIDPQDQEIIDSQIDSGESEREATDILVARMLKEEAEKGNGTESVQVETDEDGKPVKAAEVKEPGPAEAEETNNQRRRRLQREATQRTRDQRDQLKTEVARLKDRLAKIEASAPDPQRYDENQQNDYIADRSAAAARHSITAQEIEEVEERAKAADKAAERHAMEAQNDYFAEGAKKYTDFETTLKDPRLHVTVAMVETLQEDGMHDVAYWLSKQPAEMNRIAALQSPALQIKEILKAQAALEAKAVQTTTSKAPPPIKPVRASGAGTTKSPSDMTYKEYEAWRTKKSPAG